MEERKKLRKIQERLYRPTGSRQRALVPKHQGAATLTGVPAEPTGEAFNTRSKLAKQNGTICQSIAFNKLSLIRVLPRSLALARRSSDRAR